MKYLIFKDIMTEEIFLVNSSTLGPWYKGLKDEEKTSYYPAGFYLDHPHSNQDTAKLKQNTVYWVTIPDDTKFLDVESGPYIWHPYYNDVVHFERLAPLEACDKLCATDES